MPVKKANALTAAHVKNAGPGDYTDGGGLTLRVSKSGARHWFQRIRIQGKQQNLAIGSYPAVSLAEARRKALENTAAVLDGRNPIEERRAAREAATAKAGTPTFRQMAEVVIELRRPTWSSVKHAGQWTSTLQTYAYPVIGGKRIDEITTADTLAVLTPIWNSKTETATRVRQRMEAVFDYAIAQGWRTGNPAGGALSKALPHRPRLKQHHPALPYAEVPAALHAVRESSADAVTRLAFEFMVLTAARAGEVRGAAWAEVDLEVATWTIPAARMKARKEHRVPLSDQAVAVLLESRTPGGGDGLIFPAKRNGGPLSNMVFEMLLRRLQIPAVPHGFRSSFRDWTLEATATPWAVAEAALAHTLGNALTAAYARTDLFERRRTLMQEWASFCCEAGQRH